MNRFIVSMVWRETRGAWRHFLYFFVCVAVGVGALVAVSLFAAHVDHAVTREARGLLGGDLEVRSSYPLSADGQEVLHTLDQRGIMVTHVSELIAMASRTDVEKTAGQATQIVELKAVEPAYPLYGTLKLEPAQSLDRLLHPDTSPCQGTRCHGAVVQEALLLRMGLTVGSRLKIGQAEFLITALVRIEPDRMANAFSLGPRVIISQEGLQAAALIKPGSRVRERQLLKLPPGLPLEPVRGELRGGLAADHVRVTDFRDAQPQLKQFLEQLSRYLGLIGLTALFIGGLGVAMSIQAFLQEKLKTIAILKTVGADSATIVRTYVLQALGLGFLGSLAGILLGIFLQRVLPPLLAGAFVTDLLDQLGASTELSAVSIGPLLKGGSLGLLATLLFSTWPLLRVREIKPAAIFRREVESDTVDETLRWLPWWVRWGLNDRLTVMTSVIILTGLGGLSVWQAGSWKIGGLFIAGLILAVSLLVACAWMLVGGLRIVPRPMSLTLRYAIGNVVRPGGHTARILIAIGISVMVIVTVSLVEQALLRQVGETRPVDAPTFFFIDLQLDQTSSFAELVKQQTGGRAPELTPLIRSRLHSVNGEAVKVEEDLDQEERREESKDERRKQWYLSREYVLTYLDQLPKGNEIVGGTWWQPGQQFATPQVSIEEEAARSLGLKVGSSIELDIQGTTIAAEVSSIRKVDWGNFSTNFYMILSPGSLEGAPITYVATIHVPAEQEVRLQQAVVAAFPNVSAIHVGDVLENFARVLDRLALAIRAVALFCVVTGGLVMAAALAATRYRRLYESVILKALGATRGLIARTFAAEYALLGLVGGLIAIGLSSVLSWVVLTYVFDLAWSLHPTVLLTGLGITVLLTLFVGLLSTFHILGQRPLAILRYE
ncbi:MAG TPA: FtsX-like permease family protein [Nitrospira sp.]|nr:FtsX-like permease family protein [Nitrospira sp.]